jgi:hypothetical protein
MRREEIGMSAGMAIRFAVAGCVLFSRARRGMVIILSVELIGEAPK